MTKKTINTEFATIHIYTNLKDHRGREAESIQIIPNEGVKISGRYENYMLVKEEEK